MRLHKIRIIQQGGGTVVGGLSIPQNIFIKWNSILVTVQESGNCIILQSGAQPQPLSNKEILGNSIKNISVRL